MTTPLGRADLLRAYLSGGEDRLVRFVSIIGWKIEPDPTPPTPPKPPPPPPPPVSDDVVPPEPWPLYRPMPFWVVARRVERDDEAGPEVESRAGSLQSADRECEESVRETAERTPQLCPWSRLQPRILGPLRILRGGREPDWNHLLERVVRCEPVSRLPLVARPQLPQRVVLWVDRSSELAPVWLDQRRVLARLRQLLGPAIVGRTAFSDRPPPADPRSIRAWAESVVVLALSDLGRSDSSTRSARWEAWGRLLRLHGHRPVALVPEPRNPRAARSDSAWDTIPWDPSTPRRTQPTAAARYLLQLLSPLEYFEPGLLRALRLAVQANPEAPVAVDVRAEFEAWSQVAEPNLAGGTLDRAKREQLRSELSERIRQEADSVRADVGSAIRLSWQWRGSAPRVARIRDTASWEALLPAEWVDSLLGTQLQEAQPLCERVIGTLRAGEGGDALKGWIQRTWTGLPFARGDRRPDSALRQSLERAWRIADGSPFGSSAMDWLVLGSGASLSFRSADEPESASLDSKRAPVVARVRARQPLATLRASGILGTKPLRLGRDGVVSLYDADDPERANLDAQPGEVELVTDSERLTLRCVFPPAGSSSVSFHRPAAGTHGPARATLEAGLPDELVRFEWAPGGEAEFGHWRLVTPPPSWASGVGVDETGVWADVTVLGVVQRFRWIPAGCFAMGSPESEVDRDSDERQHAVWVSGFWLANTPCTQALWQAVQAKSPSVFRSPNRPVESVSWDDAVQMIKRLNQTVPGLEARLPTEAEWEYACRAGTTTPRYAEVLDKVAWYEAHPGDLDATREVASKAPNALGLFDMLGNVYEWCSDWFGPYSTTAEILVDPAGPSSGSLRVLRGGSWRSNAQLVRAALRFANRPVDRYLNLGFRLARGRRPERSDNERSEAGAERDPPEAGRGPRARDETRRRRARRGFDDSLGDGRADGSGR